MGDDEEGGRGGVCAGRSGDSFKGGLDRIHVLDVQVIAVGLDAGLAGNQADIFLFQSVIEQGAYGLFRHVHVRERYIKYF